MTGGPPRSATMLERTVAAALRVAALPQAPTICWAASAVRCLEPIFTDARLSLVLGDYGELGELRRRLACGVSDRGRQSSEARRLRTLDDALPRPIDAAPSGASVFQCALEDLAVDGRVDRAALDEWRDAGVQRILTGTRAMSPSSRRVLVARAGFAFGADAAPAQREAFSALLAPLATKARLAFGEDEAHSRPVLTEKEREVLDQLIMGKTIREIALQLRRSPYTVHDHVKALHRKLDASSRAELVARALGADAAVLSRGVRKASVAS